MKLELSSLKKAVQSHARALKVYHQKSAVPNGDPEELELLRAGVIQNFEFTYELCWKFMKRWIEINISPNIVDGVTRKELFRISAENRLISDFGKWLEYHQAHNLTSHIYDSDVAEQVYHAAKDFLTDAQEFLQRIEERND
jgi:nucleotidyltransferase substrate binding protein (TIGR01987 family)